MEFVRGVTESLARATSRRGLFGRGAQAAAGALLGVAAGTLTQSTVALGGGQTLCVPPGSLCPCENCQSTGVCVKPCALSVIGYASGCWVTEGVTCCDCDCGGPQGFSLCGCASDYHSVACTEK